MPRLPARSCCASRSELILSPGTPRSPPKSNSPWTPIRWGPTLLGAHVLADFQASLIFRWGSGLPYSRTNLAGDSLVGLPNDNRLPSTSSLDMLIRRPFRMGKLGG